MSKRRREPRYVGLAVRGADGLYYRFPDLPGFTLKAEENSSGTGHFQELQQLQDHLEELQAQGHAVPEPSLVREVMADPDNRQPHRVFDLGGLRAFKRTLAKLAEAERALDEQDMAETRRYVAFYGEDDLLAGELDFEPHPGLSLLREIFGLRFGDLLLFNCYPIGEAEARRLAPYLDTPLQLDRYAYFLEAHARHDEAPAQET